MIKKLFIFCLLLAPVTSNIFPVTSNMFPVTSNIFTGTSNIFPVTSNVASAAELKIVAEEEAAVGTPVFIRVEPQIPEGAAYLWRVSTLEALTELFDTKGDQCNMYWSLEPGTVTIELIIAAKDSDSNKIKITVCTHTLKYTALGPGPIPGPVPSPELQAKVAPLISASKALSVTKEDALNLAEFYSDFAKVIATRIEPITTAQFRAAYVKAGKLALPNLNDKYSGIAELVDAVLMSQLGDDIVELNLTKTAETLNAISWAWRQ